MDRFVAGAGQLAGGASALAGGLGTYVSSLRGLTDPAAAQPVVAQTVVPQVLDGARQTAAGLNQKISQQVLAQAAGSPPPAADLPAVAPSQGAISAACGQVEIDPAVCAQVFGAGYQGGASDVGQAVSAQLPGLLDDQLAQLVSGSVGAGLAAGAEVGVHAGATGGFVAGVTGSLQGLQTADPATGQTLADGIAALAQGAGELSSGGAPLGRAGAQLTTGGADLATGARSLAKGLAPLTAGSASLRDGATGLASGLATAATEGPALSDGLTQLASGAAPLADGTRKLADGLSAGASVPNYTAEQRTALAQAVAAPVVVPSGGVVTAEPPAAVLGWLVGTLWLGALATFAMLRPVTRRLAASNASTPRRLARSLLPGTAVVAAQAVLLALLGQVALGLSAARLGAVLAVLVLAGVVFALVNHALAAWLRQAGRGLALLLGALGLVSVITDAVPQALAAVAGASPVTAGLDAARAALVGASLTGPLLALIGVGVAAGVAAVAAVLRSRRRTPARLARGDGDPGSLDWI